MSLIIFETYLAYRDEGITVFIRQTTEKIKMKEQSTDRFCFASEARQKYIGQDEWLQTIEGLARNTRRLLASNEYSKRERREREGGRYPRVGY